MEDLTLLNYCIFLSLFLGLIMGSFINVFTLRYPVIIKQRTQEYFQSSSVNKNNNVKPLNLNYPGSHCPRCKNIIRWYDNIPVISWLCLKGVCRECKQPISSRYLFIELLTAFTFVVPMLIWGATYWSFSVMILSGLLITASVIDFDNHWLPDALTQPILWLGILTSWLGIAPLNLQDSILGAVVGYIAFSVLYWGAKLVAGKECLGMGDVILFAALGAFVGVPALIYLALIASMGGIIFCVITRKTEKSIASGPWLCLAGWLSIVFDHDNFTVFNFL